MNINTHTQLCGILGNPVEHSLSPAIHNAAFQHLELNFVYLAFPVEDVEGAVRGIRALGNIRGCSVTIPHKVTLIPHLDTVETTARHIGAINTIVKEHGTLTGYNTDASGALRALQQREVPLQGEHVVIVGSGGAARAIAFGLANNAQVGSLTILGIDGTERTGLARDLRDRTSVKVKDQELNTDSLRQYVPHTQVLIHCTPIGMHPKVQESCIPKEILHSGLTIMDIVYNPLETRLLQEAREVGCRTIRGVEMFLHQAMGQFELWTGHAAPVEVMRRVLESEFS